MTTLIAVKNKETLFLAGDSQTTSGNIKLPLSSQKIQVVSKNILVGGAGGVGNLQQVLKRTLRNIYYEKSFSNTGFDFDIDVDYFVNALASFNFEFPLEYKNFSPFGYLVGGVDKNQQNIIYSVDSDGSLISFEDYYAEGSGRDMALSMLRDKFKEGMTDEETLRMICEIYTSIDGLEIYTNQEIKILALKDGVVHKITEDFSEYFKQDSEKKLEEETGAKE